VDEGEEERGEEGNKEMGLLPVDGADRGER